MCVKPKGGKRVRPPLGIAVLQGHSGLYRSLNRPSSSRERSSLPFSVHPAHTRSYTRVAAGIPDWDSFISDSTAARFVLPSKFKHISWMNPLRVCQGLLLHFPGDVEETGVLTLVVTLGARRSPQFLYRAASGALGTRSQHTYPNIQEKCVPISSLSNESRQFIDRRPSIVSPVLTLTRSDWMMWTMTKFFDKLKLRKEAGQFAEEFFSMDWSMTGGGQRTCCPAVAVGPINAELSTFPTHHTYPSNTIILTWLPRRANRRSSAGSTPLEILEPDFVDNSGYAKYSVYHWRRTDVHLGYFGYKEFVEEDWTGSRGEFMTRAARDEAYRKHPEALNFIIANR
ncbi:hypothetical protein FB451DRAFT_1184179 [Mycena latifolia]|nr:hypothetical protein FB451DRAFT_1184179 [Mycena latifolia]